MSKEAVEEMTTQQIPKPRKMRFAWQILGVATAVLAILGGTYYVAEYAVPVKVPSPTPGSTFNGDQAFAYLEAICQLGPRISDSRAMRHQQRILRQHFEALGARVEMQKFSASQPSLNGKTFLCENLVVRWHPKSKRRVLIGCHYDTRPIADREPILRNRRDGEFLGANDGASGVAFLMELGKMMASLPLSIGVDFVFFDAEEYIYDTRRDKYFIGSEGFVRDYLKRRPDYTYAKVLVVDMIADKDLQIHPDQRCTVQHGPFVKEVWDIASELGVTQFQEDVRYDILDDHVAFQEAGIPAIVLIDFNYPYWHQLADTPDKCSGKSLEAVAAVVTEWLRRQK